MKIKGKKHNICSRKFCLDCSAFGKHNTKDLTSEGKKYKESKKVNCVCILCNREYTYKRGSGASKTKCNSCWVKERTIRRKTKLLLIAGNCCSICGYNKNYASLSFHHQDPKLKSFNLDARSIGNRSWESIINEFKKCVLLCLNCHSELHNPQCEVNIKKVYVSQLEKNILYSNFCCDCGKEINSKSTRCHKCSTQHRINNDVSKINWPPTDEILKLLEEYSYIAVGKMLGVSDNAIRQRIKTHST